MPSKTQFYIHSHNLLRAQPWWLWCDISVLWGCFMKSSADCSIRVKRLSSAQQMSTHRPAASTTTLQHSRSIPHFIRWASFLLRGTGCTPSKQNRRTQQIIPTYGENIWQRLIHQWQAEQRRDAHSCQGYMIWVTNSSENRRATNEQPKGTFVSHAHLHISGKTDTCWWKEKKQEAPTRTKQ